MSIKPSILKCLEKIAPILPFPIYWTNKDSIVIGTNEYTLKAIGFNHSHELINKSPYDFYPYDLAKDIVQHVKETIKQNMVLSQEDTIKDVSTGQIRIFKAIRAPLYDKNKNAIGVIGTSIEITEQKKAEQLKLQYHNQLLQEQKRFTKLAQQVAHDIRSPLAALQLPVTSCTDLPEHKRNALRDVANRINEIADNLLTQYKHADTEIVIDEPQPVLVSTAINQIVAEKKIALQHKNIELTTNINPNSKLAFINIEPVAY